MSENIDGDIIKDKDLAGDDADTDADTSDGESINDVSENEGDDDNDDEDGDDDDASYHSDDDTGIKKKGEPDETNNPPLFNTFDDEDEDDEEEDDDEHYLQKFDKETQQKIIADFHPELQSHNYDEIDILSRVVRDQDGIVIDPLHKTLPFISRYEKARILGERAKQINSGGKPFVEVDQTVIDGYLIALKEFEEKKIPFIIKRPLPNGGVEYWKFADLDILA